MNSSDLKLSSLKEDLKKLTEDYKDTNNINELLDYISLVIDRLDGEIPYCDTYIDNNKDENCPGKLIYVPKNLPDTKENIIWYHYYNHLFEQLLILFDTLRNKTQLSSDKINEIKEITKDMYDSMIEANKYTKEQLFIISQKLSARICVLRLNAGLPISPKHCDPKKLTK
jgi:hypothetical protein